MANWFERLGSTTVQIEDQEIVITDVEVEQFPTGNGHPKNTIIRFQAPRELLPSGQEGDRMAIIKPYSISGPSELPEETTQRIDAIRRVIHNHLSSVYGKK